MDKLMLPTFLFFIIVGFGYVDGALHLGSECSRSQNSTGDTTYQSNMRTLLDLLAKNTPLQDGFFNTSVGNGSNQVYGLGWCRTYVSPSDCFDCLNESISLTLRECPASKGLVIWSSLCSLRFSNWRFFGEVWNSSSSSSYNGKGLDESSVFSKGFMMMETLGRSVPDQLLMYDTSVIDVGKDGSRYGLGQCSWDLSKSACQNCLGDLLVNYRTYVLNRTGWEMLGVSCGMWYDDIWFYDNNSSSTPTPNTSGGGESLYQGNVISWLLWHFLFSNGSH